MPGRDEVWGGSVRGQLDQATTFSVAHEATMQTARALVGCTVAEVERHLILETLKHCLGNRTHAATILGISLRTLRNKLNEYSGRGMPIPPALSGLSHQQPSAHAG